MTRKSPRNMLKLILILSTLSFRVHAETAGNLNLGDVLDSLDLQMSWNPIIEQAVFSRGSDFLSVSATGSSAVFDATKRISFPEGGYDPIAGTLTPVAYESLKKVFPPKPKSEAARSITTIFLDPGHGGKDPGAIGHFVVDGKTVTLNEKDLVLSVGVLLRELLKAKYPDKTIVLSRDTDVYLPLDERTRLANKYSQPKDQTTIFVSLHANASFDGRGRGYEAWYLPPEYRRQLIKEGDVQVQDKSVIPIINSILEEEYTVESIILARDILGGMDASTQGASPNRGMKAEEWYVVRSARMPSVLIELGFVTTKDDFLLLRTPAYLQKIAEGIYNGITSFVSDYESDTNK